MTVTCLTKPQKTLFMNKFKTTIFILCLLGSYVANAQNAYWVMYPSIKFSLAQNSMTPLPGTPSTCTQANAKGLFDANGNLIFYVSNDKIYDKNGAQIFTIPTTPANSQFTYCVKGIHIVPVPGGSCGEYFVIYTRFAESGLSGPNVGGPTDLYEMGAIKVTVNASQNISVSSNISTVTYSDLPTTLNPQVQTALSKESNNERTLFALLERSANPNHNTNQLVRIKVDNNGLTKNGGFLNTTVAPYVSTSFRSLEISPNQASLVWVQATVGVAGKRLGVMNLATGTISEINIPLLANGSELEFGANSNDLYFTTSQGIYKTSLSNPASTVQVAGTSNAHYAGNIELGLNGKLYATATNHILYTITGTNAVTGNYYAQLRLPEQVDGENIFYQAPTPLTALIAMTSNGTTQASVSGGSGNYSYTWRNSLGNIVATGHPVLLPGGKFGAQHTLTVKDNVTGCSTDFLFYNYPLSFRNTNTDLTVGKAEVHPNPASDYINVQTNANEQIMQLEVVNLKGQTALKAKGNQTAKQRLSINGLTKGMYILNIITNASSSRIKFLVK